MSKISVVLPSYNHSKYIKLAVESVLSQTHEDLELIIIDDGSTDTSVEIIQSIKDDRIQLIKQKNAGAHNAINKGLALAKGDFISILNSDDQYHRDRLKTTIEYLESEQCDFASTWITLIDDNGNTLGTKKAWENLEPWPFKEDQLTYRGSQDYLKNLIMSNFISTTGNMVFRRSVVDAGIKMRSLRFVHDWDFAIKVAERFACISVDTPLYYYRIHGENTISSNYKEMMFEICLLWAEKIDSLSYRLLDFKDINALCDSLDKLYESINFQGNSKLVFLMNILLSRIQTHLNKCPLERLIEDSELKDFFISKIVELS